ncbi:VOC family protein [Lutimaribacter sp. EGI FJ00015]|uniref:VOC family protein n=1 Tax=Lutimaribacter degradans TaxID=2945989 RepID=A0ACC6A041_9RHOB|nr:VOC family protein [Lutimaribacter sp. EGI FJ00013]MCM2563818.1 VOC family protein [Lutimaribacter sp. EGI FJ00013]MCO0615027.1 VOC family protein [Lutimaribacter sp. EGI FJ00015]MCO0637691.1 VOC family protein [Lutimaribacter sp. EGI FJ00014]
MLMLDHIAVAAETLDEGRAHLESMLGITLNAGGHHAVMGTHNLLTGMEDGLYFELIAIDPEAAAPNRPRWFDLDRFSGPPRLTNWICGTDDMDAALAALPGAGEPLEVERGDLRWRMGVPADGVLPFDKVHPALIEWQGDVHPVQRLPNSGLRLLELRVMHPRADALRAALAPHLSESRVSYVTAQAPGLEAVLDSPLGRKVLR